MTTKTTPDEVYDLMEKHHGYMENGEVTLRTDRIAALIDEVRAQAIAEHLAKQQQVRPVSKAEAEAQIAKLQSELSVLAAISAGGAK